MGLEAGPLGGLEGSKKFQKGPRKCGWAEVLILGADSKCLFLRGEPACGGWDQGSHLRKVRYSPGSPKPTEVWMMQASASAGPAGPENPDCNPLGQPEEDASASPCVKRWDCLPSTPLLTRYLLMQGSILGCFSSLLYPQQTQTRGFRRERGEREAEKTRREDTGPCLLD